MESNIKRNGIKVTLVMDAEEALWLKRMCQDEPQPFKETEKEKQIRQSFLDVLPAISTLKQHINEQ